MDGSEGARGWGQQAGQEATVNAQKGNTMVYAHD